MIWLNKFVHVIYQLWRQFTIFLHGFSVAHHTQKCTQDPQCRCLLPGPHVSQTNTHKNKTCCWVYSMSSFLRVQLSKSGNKPNWLIFNARVANFVTQWKSISIRSWYIGICILVTKVVAMDPNLEFITNLSFNFAFDIQNPTLVWISSILAFWPFCTCGS